MKNVSINAYLKDQNNWELEKLKNIANVANLRIF
jgi:hypothetical protein